MSLQDYSLSQADVIIRNKIRRAAAIACVLVFVLIACAPGDGGKVVTINGRNFLVPKEVWDTRFGFAGLSAAISFRINAETLKVLGKEEKEQKSSNQESKAVDVQLFGQQDAAGFMNTQSAYKLLLQEKPPESCQDYIVGGEQYGLCYYSAVHKNDTGSTRLLVNRRSGKILSHISCTDTIYKPRNPRCLARGYIFDDTQISYTFGVRYVDEIAVMNHAITALVLSFHAKANEETTNAP